MTEAQGKSKRKREDEARRVQWDARRRLDVACHFELLEPEREDVGTLLRSKKELKLKVM